MITIREIKWMQYTGTDPQPGFVSLYVDDVADLPTVAQIRSAANVDPLPGSDATLCSSGVKYLLDSSGAWHEVTAGGYVDAYSKTQTDTLLAAKVDTSTYTAGQAAQDALIAGKVDTTTFDAHKLIYEDTGRINLYQKTWTRTAGTSGVWIADLYDCTTVDTIVSVIITGFGGFKPAEFDLFYTYIPSSVSGMHKIRGAADADLYGLTASSPYVNLRVFGYGVQS